MTRVARLLHLDDGEFPALREQIEAKPMLRVGVPATTRRPLRIDEQARSLDALAGIRSEAPVLDLRVVNGIGMRRPAAPKPGRDPHALRKVEASAFIVATLVRAYDSAADELESALAELAELAPFAAKAGA